MKIAFLEGRYTKPRTTLTLQGEPEALGTGASNYFKSCTFHNTTTIPVLEFTHNFQSTISSVFVPNTLEIYHLSINRAAKFGGLGQVLISPNQTICSEDLFVTYRSLFASAPATLQLPLKQPLDLAMHDGDVIRIYLRLYEPPATITNVPIPLKPIGDIEKYSNNNVLFLFPHHSLPPRQLWANKDLLITSSTYFKDLFASGFAESEKTFSIPPLPSNLFEISTINKEECFTDSDSEDFPSNSTPLDSRVYRIIIRETSYKTYKALLYYLVHGNIFFGTLSSAKVIVPALVRAVSAATSSAPTSSVFGAPFSTPVSTSFPAPSSTTSPPTGIFSTPPPAIFAWPPATTSTFSAASVTLSQPSPPTGMFSAASVTLSQPQPPTSIFSAPQVILPQPQPQPPTPSEILKLSLTVSPKSIYRLAHQLELTALKALALRSFTAQLSSKNVIVELFSEFSLCYDECRESAWKVAKSDWENVVKSKGMEDLEKGIESGEIVGRRASLAIELMKQLKV